MGKSSQLMVQKVRSHYCLMSFGTHFAANSPYFLKMFSMPPTNARWHRVQGFPAFFFSSPLSIAASPFSIAPMKVLGELAAAALDDDYRAFEIAGEAGKSIRVWYYQLVDISLCKACPTCLSLSSRPHRPLPPPSLRVWSGLSSVPRRHAAARTTDWRTDGDRGTIHILLHTHIGNKTADVRIIFSKTLNMLSLLCSSSIEQRHGKYI